MAQTLSDAIVHFLKIQDFVIVSTLDADGSIHCSAKGLVDAKRSGTILLFDLYLAGTFRNLSLNPVISITAVDEHLFVGYTLKGKARAVKLSKVKKALIEGWRKRIASRISKRLIKNVQRTSVSFYHPEASLPDPEYLIEMKVSKITDLAPAHLKRQHV